MIVVACGERAGEVVETIHDFAEMTDPRTGGKLMDRTIIICNTSSMPVAAREASIYTGITLGEYYRQMGLDVLLSGRFDVALGTGDAGNQRPPGRDPRRRSVSGLSGQCDQGAL